MQELHTFDNQQYYHALNNQAVGNIQIYRVERQRGGSFSNVARLFSKYVIPLINRYIIPHARQSLVTTASDMLEGASLKSALKKNSKTLAQNILTGISNQQKGGAAKKRSKKVFNFFAK